MPDFNNRNVDQAALKSTFDIGGFFYSQQKYFW